ncbi:MAG TPA: D-alanine--D-alanine ligase family protein [Spirochaetia bacterium]
MTVCILYGGKSGEHEVSQRSAASVVRNLDAKRHAVVLIGIDKQGRWHLQEGPRFTTIEGQGEVLGIGPSRGAVSVVPSDGIHVDGRRLPIDCVFPVLHGTFGEDGTIQGLLETAGIPYVGAGVLGSSASMDKEAAKRLWRDAGLPIVEFEVVRRGESEETWRAAAGRIGFPVFVKPVSAGSSLGAARVDAPEGLRAAVEDALRYDTRALVEKCVDAREIECAVIGNAEPRAFAPGEIVTSREHGFYSYDAKYTDPDGASLETRADLAPAVRELVMRTAESAYAVIRCEGMARVDFFIDRKSGKVSLNEINTLPGFTSISMFPRMCEASGLPYPRLLETLIDLAMARDAERRTVRFEK